MAILEAPRSQLTRGPQPRRSDADCFSGKTDKTKPLELKCACGADSVGGVPIEFKQSVMDKTIGLFKFLCGNCRKDETYAVTNGIMNPSWKLVIQQAPGLYWLRHLTEAEQEKLVTK